MSSYDDALSDYNAELLAENRKLYEEIEELQRLLSRANRKIAILENQLTHYYL